jgi:hypothetical protein
MKSITVALVVIVAALLARSASAVVACPRALASPSRTWLDPDSGRLMVSTPYEKNNEVIYPTASAMEIRGMGYAPAPVGTSHHEKPYGDWYTQNYEYLWSVDIPRMAEIGVNVVRVWNWKLFDVPNHISFLDTLYNNKMYALIPFEMFVPDGRGDVTFRDLTKDEVRNSAVSQFRIFARELVSHPAVLGFMIGNELTSADKYGTQLELFFSLINDMIVELRKIEATLPDMNPCRRQDCRHFVTTPLKADDFQKLYTNFFWSKIDFWSFHPYYDATALRAALSAYTSFATEAIGVESEFPKPVLLTERGTGSVKANGTGVKFGIHDDEKWQADFLRNSWETVTSYSSLSNRGRGKTWSPALGMVIMEWNDEWWKGDQNSLPIEGCPESDASGQSNCGTLVDAKSGLVIAEERLGICAQEKYTPSFLNSIFLGIVPHNLKCKQAFTTVCTMWNGKNCDKRLIERLDRTASNYSLFILNAAPFACLIVTLIWGAILVCLRRRTEDTTADLNVSQSSTNFCTSIAVDTSSASRRFNAILDCRGAMPTPVPIPDPRLDWLIDDLLRRAEIRSVAGVERFRAMWTILVATVAPARQSDRDGRQPAAPAHEDPAAKAASFSSTDFHLSNFVEAVQVVHKETMAYVGIRNWRDRYSKISHMARSDEPDVQLQEIVLYYSVRLEHHAIGHAVEFVTENFLTMREALLTQQNVPTSDATREAAWTALADRVDAAYNVMFNGQLHERVARLTNKLALDPTKNGETDGVTTTTIDGVSHAVLRFSATEPARFRALAGALERIHGDEHVRFLRPVAIDEGLLAIVFSERPEEIMGDDLHRSVKKLGGIDLALHVCYSLETLHSVKVAHGSINASHVGQHCLKDSRVAWVLLPAATMQVLSPERVIADLAALGQLIETIAEETSDKPTNKLLSDVGKALQQTPPLSLELCIEQLEQNKPHCLETPEKPPSYEDLNQTALDQRSKHGGKSVTAPLVGFRRSFAETGGVLAAICNYSFFMRYMLWQWVYSYTSQPVLYNRPVCIARTMEILALGDALVCFVTYFAEVRLLAGSTHRFKQITAAIHMIVYFVLFAGLFFIGAVIQVVIALGPYELVLTPHSIYVIAVIILFLVKDIIRFCATTGRGEHGFESRSSTVRPGACGRVLRGVLYAINWILLLVPLAILTDLAHRDNNPIVSPYQFFLPSAISLLLVFIYNLALGLFATVCRCCHGSLVYRLAIEDQLGAPAIFWTVNYLSFNAAMSYFIVPGIAFIDGSLCNNSSRQQWLACNVAWLFNWAAFVVVSFALFGILYIGWSLLASVLVAFARSIGELHSLTDVLGKLGANQARNRVMASVMAGVRGESPLKQVGAIALFEAVLQSMVDDHKMSPDEKEKLLNWFIYADKRDGEEDALAKDAELRSRTADRNFRLENIDAEMMIVMFLASLENMPARKGYDVQSMPSFTALVPYFNEIIFHDFQSMRAQPTELSSGVPSDLRMAAGAWPDEWRRLTEQMRREGLLPSNATEDELLETYHRYCYLKYPSERAKKLIHAVERWITYRNQTLARIVRGIALLRKGLVMVAKQELAASEPFANDEDLTARSEALVTDKFQVLIGAQIMAKMGCNETADKMETRLPRCQLSNLIELQARNPFIEYAFEMELEDGMTPAEKFEHMLDHVRVETDGSYNNIVYDRVTSLCGVRQHFCGTRYYSCHVTLTSQTAQTRVYELNVVERPGPLLLGPKYAHMAPRGLHTQGKAENQFHAAQFARGSNFFALDMNQDMCITEGFKLPTMLHHFVGGNKRHKYGIVGFTERCYTRTTSLSGELSGASEFAFVTIVQRVLRSALRIRMHYGHPDLMSGLLARTIGFNKASHGVNVNEDIFAGYECLARGVPIGFCEWIWFWKGRDTSLRLVAIFNNKLAEGAAQQVRSRDMHFLNANLNWLSRSSLLLGTVGFYWMSVLLHASIRLYIWSLLLFEVSGVSNFDIGVANGIISVAWAFQLGYVMALPGLIENTVQYGLMKGVLRFLRFVIPSVFFHAFMLQVVSEGFITGLFTNAAAYAGTGRGFDLPPMDVARSFIVYGVSHYWKAVEFFVVVFWYLTITAENSLSYFLRTVTVWVLIAALFGAPFFFQAPPNGNDMTKAGSRLWTWVLRKHEQFGTHKHLIVPEKIEDAESRSFRTWFTRRFASPLYVASFRSARFFNFFELFVSTAYRELPALALMLVYFDTPMIPLMLTAAFMVLQVVVLRKLFSGRYQRHFSRIMMITVFVFVACLTVFYLAARVLFFAPVVTLVLVLYFCRFVGVFFNIFGTLRGTTQAFLTAGARLAMLDYPVALLSAVVTYGLA